MNALGLWGEAVDVTTRILYGPLAALHFNGPGLLGWRGQSAIDICAAISGVQAAFWSANMDACVDILINNFQGWVSLINCVVVYGGVLMLFIRLLRQGWQPRSEYVVIPQRRLLSPSTSARYRQKALRYRRRAADSGSGSE